MSFYLPTRLLTGPEILLRRGELLAELGTRCLVVTGKQASLTCPALQDAKDTLQRLGIPYLHFDGVLPNPGIETCVQAGRMAHAFGADFVLGIGGGSALDAAKAIALSAANPELDGPGLYRLNWPSPALPIALVGTTAGTGSEVTPVAVITDTVGRKHSFRHDCLYARLAYGDPRYTASMSLTMTANTGVDALAHCIESFFSRKATPLSSALALAGVRQLVPRLIELSAGRTPDPAARADLYEGSILGGMAISITGTVLPHNLGYYLTETYGVPHGAACAVFEPWLLAHCAAAVPDRAEMLCRAAGLSVDELSNLIRQLCPPCFPALTESEVERILPRWKDCNALKVTVGCVTEDVLRQLWLQVGTRTNKNPSDT